MDSRQRRARDARVRKNFMDTYPEQTVGTQVRPVLVATVRPGTDINKMPDIFEGMQVKYIFGHPAKTLIGNAE